MQFHPLIHPDIPGSYQKCPETAVPYYTALGWIPAPPPPPGEPVSVTKPVAETKPDLKPVPESSTPDAPAETPSPAKQRGSRASKED